jgi:hypothetical protein
VDNPNLVDSRNKKTKKSDPQNIVPILEKNSPFFCAVRSPSGSTSEKNQHLVWFQHFWLVVDLSIWLIVVKSGE